MKPLLVGWVGIFSTGKPLPMFKDRTAECQQVVLRDALRPQKTATLCKRTGHCNRSRFWVCGGKQPRLFEKLSAGDAFSTAEFTVTASRCPKGTEIARKIIFREKTKQNENTLLTTYIEGKAPLDTVESPSHQTSSSCNLLFATENFCTLAWIAAPDAAQHWPTNFAVTKKYAIGRKTRRANGGGGLVLRTHAIQQAAAKDAQQTY